MKAVTITELAGVTGTRYRFEKTGQEFGFSNFCFLENLGREFSFNWFVPSLIRVFSFARKLNYRGLLIDDISDTANNILAEENDILRTYPKTLCSHNLPKVIQARARWTMAT